ncbi:hypothetical protein [Photobacterium kagoshimensis]|uniref:hypothetical protein n=1 Tax=Photobacterium kagoshimensis TaxID=2910242 RepID=UPI003D123D86
MKPALHYNCPICTGDSEVKLKEMNKLSKNNQLSCSICGADLQLNTEGIKTLNCRVNDFKALAPYHLLVNGIIFLSMLLHFIGSISTSELIIGVVIGIGILIKVQSTQFDDALLTFQE